MLLVPIVGGLIVGIMARYGSDKIRGHGIPEAIEAILLNGARVEPKIAILKPISAAISIGSGGPFGAEGPIIMTGGAFGSLIAQWVHLTDAERTTLLVAGAAAGMSATFAAPFAAILLAVELLLFEWRPRSLIPVAFASITAAVVRVFWLGAGPLFAMPALPNSETATHRRHSPSPLGVLIGLAAAGLSRMMYGFEDLFGKLPMHWMWWPAIGGLGIGVGGLFFPHGLGVGYDNIAVLLPGNAPLAPAPRPHPLQIAHVGLLPRLRNLRRSPRPTAHDRRSLRRTHRSPRPCLRPKAASGTRRHGRNALRLTRVPLTAIVFSLEITHALPALLPLMLGCIAAYTVTSLIMPRSILTEKLARRGYHLTREYGIDPLETVSRPRSHDRDRTPAPRQHHPPRRLRLHRRDLPRRRRKDGHRRPQLPRSSSTAPPTQSSVTSPSATSSADARNPYSARQDRQRVFSPTR